MFIRVDFPDPDRLADKEGTALYSLKVTVSGSTYQWSHAFDWNV